jgi:hypothetical protein
MVAKRDATEKFRQFFNQIFLGNSNNNPANIRNVFLPLKHFKIKTRSSTYDLDSDSLKLKNPIET